MSDTKPKLRKGMKLFAAAKKGSKHFHLRHAFVTSDLLETRSSVQDCGGHDT